jgi:4,5-dihydroxyphthalate decarboxylase
MSAVRVRIGRYAHTARLLEAPLVLQGEVADVQPATPGLTAREMVRDLACDACELPVVNYFSAREHGVPFTALPVFLTRRFPHATLVRNRRTGVMGPKDLEGRRVGIGYYGNTDPTWAQGVLSIQFGVDCERITFVASQEEQISGAYVPPNVERIGEQAATRATDALPSPQLSEMLRMGDLAAVIYGAPPTRYPDPDIGPLFENLADVEQDWFSSTGVFPILHTFVISDAAQAIAAELFTALSAARQAAIANPRAVDAELLRAAPRKRLS